jgi:hypothetical protein
MLKVYIAAPFPLRAEAVKLMQFLEAAGHAVTSTWLRKDDMPDSDAAARLDLADVRRADVLVALNPPGWETKGSGGRHCELGSALTLGKPIVLMGPRTNTFHYHSDVEAVASRDQVLEVLTRMWAGRIAARA